MKSNSFKATVNYILDRAKDAKLIDSEGVRISDNNTMISSFIVQAQLSNRVTKCVGHIALNFSEQDKNKLTDELMAKIAREYMQKMNITNTQYIIGRHFDKSHPHIHICYNRIDNDGKTISDKNDRIRSGKICKELTLQYGLYYADTERSHVKTHRLKEPHKTKHEIFRTIGESLSMSSNWSEFLQYIQSAEIDVQFKTKGESNEIQGIIFKKNGYSFNGSKIASKYSYPKLNAVLSSQNSLEMTNSQQINTSSLHNEKTVRIDLSILDAVPTHLYSSDDGETRSRRKRRKL